MTKKDYILIAKNLAFMYETSKITEERETVVATISLLIIAFKADNQKFNPDTFLKACFSN